jgi:hypothetical protein
MHANLEGLYRNQDSEWSVLRIIFSATAAKTIKWTGS